VVEKGQTVFMQDEPGDRMFVVADGAVKLHVSSRQGDIVELVRLDNGADRAPLGPGLESSAAAMWPGNLPEILGKALVRALAPIHQRDP
jgi:hypothetical protein